jgi:hypothetical protein
MLLLNHNLMHMKATIILSLFLFLLQQNSHSKNNIFLSLDINYCYSLLQQTNKPDLRATENTRDIVVKKAESGGFWIYHKPSNYHLKEDVDYRSFWVGNNYAFYLIEKGSYYIVNDYETLPANNERYLEYVTGYDAVFFRTPKGNRTYYKGIQTSTIYINTSIYNEMFFKDPKTNRSFSILKSIYYNNPYYKLQAIWSN